MIQKHPHDVLIIGAGAAGLVAAISASERGQTVLLIEKNAQAGSKILISGGGRCNFTNLDVSPHNYVCSTSRFCAPALKAFRNSDFIRWVQSQKIPYYEKERGQLFCKTSSKQILNMLINKLDAKLVTLQFNADILDVQKDEKRNLFMVRLNDGIVSGRTLIIATGGLSHPELGATDLGYRIAKGFGHEVTGLTPALDGLLWPPREETSFGELSGISVRVRIKTGSQTIDGDLLFTHWGISGPAVLNVSLYWERGAPIEIDFLPEVSLFQRWFHEQRQLQSKKTLMGILSQLFPTRLSNVFCVRAGLSNQIQNTKAAQVSKKDVVRLETAIKKFSFVPKSTRGFKTAEVTRGGVDTSQVNSKTMESRLVTGLFFAGEVLDVTGELGGYNLQWAWSSGWVAGSNWQLPQ